MTDHKDLDRLKRGVLTLGLLALLCLDTRVEASSLGAQKTLVLIGAFANRPPPVDLPAAKQRMAEVDAFYRAQSSGNVRFEGVRASTEKADYVFFTSPLNGSSCGMAASAYTQSGLPAAAAAGLHPGQYNRHIVFIPSSGCFGRGGASGKVAFVYGNHGIDVIAHELGHTYGCGHAKCFGNGEEYCDRNDIMANTGGPFGPYWKELMGLPLPALLASSGEHIVGDYDAQTPNIKSIKIPKLSAPGCHYYVTYRNGTGYSAGKQLGIAIHEGCANGQFLHRYLNAGESYAQPGLNVSVISITQSQATIRVGGAWR